MKVVVAGCSFSDYTGKEVTKVYGEILANSLNAEYIHEGAGVGSNYRMWRKVTNLVMDDKITSTDLVIMQYTEVTRQEYWHAIRETRDNNIYIGPNRQQIREPAYGGDIIRWKMDIADYGHFSSQRKFFQLKENYFTSSEFDDERFKYNHYLFHNAMMRKDINVVYLVCLNSVYGGIFRHLFNDNNETHITYEFDEKFTLPNDIFHMNQKGHENVAKILEEELKEKQLI